VVDPIGKLKDKPNYLALFKAYINYLDK